MARMDFGLWVRCHRRTSTRHQASMSPAHQHQASGLYVTGAPAPGLRPQASRDPASRRPTKRPTYLEAMEDQELPKVPTLPASSMQRAASAACGRTCAHAHSNPPPTSHAPGHLIRPANADLPGLPGLLGLLARGGLVRRRAQGRHAVAKPQPQQASRLGARSDMQCAQAHEAVRACLPGRPPARPPRATLHPPCTQPDAPLSHRRPSLPILDPPPLHPRACLATRAARRGCFDFRPLRRATLPHRPPAPPGPS
ncbi:hypothetical protein L1887_63481 [Cichorium endivia]|nr:hypothetical protein L1887_63481 [Cichorium endivia]